MKRSGMTNCLMFVGFRGSVRELEALFVELAYGLEDLKNAIESRNLVEE